MNETLQTVFGLIGGLAVFLYGMNMMSEGLQKAAGDKMKYILGLLTKNAVVGVLAGALTTAVLQSSSATTVMVIGFVSAGLMTLPQAISIILGANIGTTMTAQIIAFSINDYIWPIVAIGFFVYFIAKSPKVKNIGQTIFAFGLLFVGIETMGSVMKPLASSPVFTNLIGQVGHIPVLGVLVGTMMTLVVQSSSATIAVLQNFASQAGPDGVHSVLGLTGAIPILLGDNIGTTITALLACIGQSKNAKRTAVAHCIFNISGCLIFIWIVPWFAKFVQMISPKGNELDIIARQIANAHTSFNICMTLVWIPMIWLMVKIVMHIIPDNGSEMRSESEPLYLDEKIIHQPAFAIHLVAKEIARCSDLTKEMLGNIKNVILDNDLVMREKILEKGKAVETLGNEVQKYLTNLFSAGVLTEEQANQTAGIMCILSDIDRISNLTTEMAQVAVQKKEKKLKFSKDAARELGESLTLIQDMYEDVFAALNRGDTQAARGVLNKKEKVLNLELNLRKHHVTRLNKGKCKPEMTGIYTTVLNGIERIGNSCTNMAELAMTDMKFSYLLEEKEKETEAVVVPKLETATA